jgi:putative peptidoglycan lipid II flippase
MADIEVNRSRILSRVASVARTTTPLMRTLRFISSETRGMHQAAYILAAFSLASQLLGLLRDRLLASAFGAGHTLDLYYAAFRVPDLIFATIASLFSIYALLPILSRFESEREGLMVKFLRDVVGIFFLGMTVVAGIAFLCAPLIAPFIAPGLSDPASRADLILLVRILLLQPIFLGASNTIAALTQLRHRFILYSISPLLYNLSIIFGAIVLYPHFGIQGLGWGVVLGALLHMGVQLPYFLQERPASGLSFSRVLSGVREVLMLSVPRTLALASTQISLLALVAIASLLAPGSIAVFMFAYNLQSVPLTIIGVSYAVAAFPTLARLHARGARDEFLRYIEAALRHVVFWTIPATVFVVVLRAQIVRVILGAGQFDWDATRLTAAALALFVLSLGAQSLTLIIARAYYAIGDTRKPFYFGCADILVSILSGLALLAAFKTNTFFHDLVESLLRVQDVPGSSVLMLSFGYALGSIAEFVVSYFYFARDFSLSQANLRRLTFESFAASVIGGASAYGVLLISGSNAQINTTVSLMLQSIVSGVIGLSVAGGILWLLKNREFAEAVAAFRRRFASAALTAVEPSDIS